MSLSVADIKKKLRGYKYGDMTARDVHALMGNFKSLKLQEVKPFVHANGTRENCASLTGTIPVQIRGVTYNIPLTIWLRPTHPYVPPMVYVTPTRDMGIQQSQFVDANGVVYLPYLNEWKVGTSDLSALCQIMCATFADHCPVYSKSAAPPQPSWGQQPIRPPATYATPNPYGARPPYPQYPPQQQQYPGRQPQPPYPPHSSPYPVAQSAMPTPYGAPAAAYRQQSPQTAYPQPQGQYPGMYQQQPTPTSSVPTSYHNPHSPAVATVTALGASAVISAEEERRHFEESRRIERQSLESAVEDKIRRQVKQVLDAAQEEMDGLLKTQEELKQGSQKVNQMIQDMENKKTELNQSVNMLQSKNAELESVLDYLRAQPEEIDVDEAVQATNPLYNQILRLYAEENAIDDTIYYLGEALRKGIIELDVFLKHVRELSRQQFMARATIMKARSAAGLPEHGVPA